MEDTIIMERTVVTKEDVVRVAKFLGAKTGVVGLKLVGGFALSYELYYGVIALGAATISGTCKAVREATEKGVDKLNEYAENL